MRSDEIYFIIIFVNVTDAALLADSCLCPFITLLCSGSAAGESGKKKKFHPVLTDELAPQIRFPEDHDYDSNPGLVIKFEADIDYLKDEQAYHTIFKF